MRERMQIWCNNYGDGGEMMKDVLRGNMATAVGAKLCRPNVIPAYPITPSTLFPEKISEFVANGELDAEFILVESEHSAMSACIGASAAGARVCTATASQGLELMHEMLFVASGMRLPIVMAVGNRALSAPINIWCDHQDTISARDSGWIQFYAENNQECLDYMIIAFRVSEDKRVLLPSMVGLDAFVLTHTMEIVDIPEQNEVDDFLPSYNPEHCILDPKKPMTLGSFCPPEYYMEFKYQQEEAMRSASQVIDEIFKEFERKFGRSYSKVVPFMCNDADIIIVTMGSMSGTARAAVRKMREKGKKVGVLKIAIFRPFPEKEIKEIIKRCKIVAVADRNISFGYGGAVYAEIAGILVNCREKPLIADFIIGLGGRDIVKEDFEKIVNVCEKILEKGDVDKRTHWIGLNEDLL